MTPTRWTIEELQKELERFEKELRSAGLRESTILTYVERPARFLRWLTNDYQPRGPNS